MNRINLLLLAVLLAGCRAPRVLDADEQAIVNGTRDRQSAGEMLLILNAGRALNFH
jgi:hypothetical protein